MSSFNIIISGSNGFLGSSLVSLLKKHNLTFQKIDIKKNFFENIEKEKIRNYLLKKIKKKKKNILVHLGWGDIGNPNSKYHLINFKKTQIIFDICSSLDFSKIIFCGSINEYGNIEGKLDESLIPKKFESRYARYKFLSTQYGLQNIRNFFCVRPSYIYGYNQRKGTLIDLLLNSIKLKKVLSMSDCIIYRDYIFINDVSRAFYEIIFSNIPSGIYNVGSEKIITLRFLINLIAKKSSFDKKYLNFSKQSKKYLPHKVKSYLCTKKLRKLTNWKMNYTLSKGIEEILKWNKIRHIN